VRIEFINRQEDSCSENNSAPCLCRRYFAKYAGFQRSWRCVLGSDCSLSIADIYFAR
jgi:hypothetical protein